MFQILVNSTDRTEYISKDSLEIQDVLTSQTDSASFLVKAKDWSPSKGDEILIYFDSDLVFGGNIIEVQKSDRIFAEIVVTCQDWSFDLDRKKIAKVYRNLTAKEIIEDIIETVNDELGTSFTTNNVQDTITFDKVVFNYLEASKCIEELANALNWQWYIDSAKDIHFFAKGVETASFNVDDESTDIIRETLQIADGMSELRNSIIIRGGEFEGAERDEIYTSDGVQTTVNLAYKYATLPTVLVDGTPILVGVENLDNLKLDAEEVGALWDYNQKYLRFKNPVAEGLEVETSGTPLFPLIVPTSDELAIEEFGLREHTIVDRTITSMDLAIERGLAELEAYARGVQSGMFQTYTHGLRSGQMINVNSEKLGISDDYLIRAVTARPWGNTGAIYDIELASNKVIGIIELLQELLLRERKGLSINENEVPNIVKVDSRRVEVEESITLIAPEDDHQDLEVEEIVRVPDWEAEFVIAPYFPVDDDDPKTPMSIGISSYIY